MFTEETVKVKWKGLRDTYRRELKKQRSLAASNGGSENTKDPSWTHYGSMNFLREYMGSNNNHNDIMQFQGWTTDETVAEDVSPTEEAFNSFVSSANIMEAITTDKEHESESTSTEEDSNQNEVKAEPRSPQNIEERSHSPQTGREDGKFEKIRNAAKKVSFVSKVNKKPKEHRLRSKLRKKSNKVLHHAGIARSSLDDSDDDLYFFKSLIPYVKSLPPTRKLCLRSEIHNLVLREIMTECTSNSTQSVIPLEHVSVGLNG